MGSGWYRSGRTWPPPSRSMPSRRLKPATVWAPPCQCCREWVSSEDGEAVATQLISVLVAEHLSATGKGKDRRGCGARRGAARHGGGSQARRPACKAGLQRWGSQAGYVQCRFGAYLPRPRLVLKRPVVLWPLPGPPQAAWPRTWQRRCSRAAAPISRQGRYFCTVPGQRRGCVWLADGPLPRPAAPRAGSPRHMAAPPASLPRRQLLRRAPHCPRRLPAAARLTACSGRWLLPASLPALAADCCPPHCLRQLPRRAVVTAGGRQAVLPGLGAAAAGRGSGGNR